MKQNIRFRPLFVSITGDIASGKSSVSRMFRQFDYPVFSADEITRELLSDEKITEQLILLFGDKILVNSSLDKQRLRDIVFSDNMQLEKLTTFLHPKILLKLQNIMDDNLILDSKCIFFEIPLLFECKLEKCFDLNIVVIADYETKIQRILKRDNCTEEIAKKIIKKQMQQKVKEKKADIIVENNSDFIDLSKQLNIIIQLIPFIKKRTLNRVVK